MDNDSSFQVEPEIPRSVSLLFFGMFAGLGTLFFVYLSVIPVSTYLSAKSWAETPCTILASNVERKESKATADRQMHDKPKFKVAIRYSYVIDAKKYEGRRYDLMDIATVGSKDKRAIVKQYPAGRKATCYVNPKNPEEAIINRDASLQMLWGLFPLPFMLIGYWGLINMMFCRN